MGHAEASRLIIATAVAGLLVGCGSSRSSGAGAGPSSTTTPPQVATSQMTGPPTSASAPRTTAAPTPSTTAPTGAHAPTTIVAGASDNGRQMSVARGDTVEVRLTGTDAGWNLMSLGDPAVLGYRGERTVMASGGANPAGGGSSGGGNPSLQIFTFAAVGRGTTSVEFAQPGGTPASYRLTVSVS
ncbi:MAG: hypothetical protein ACYDH6_09360 [Acidimicrobiales bacterium]